MKFMKLAEENWKKMERELEDCSAKLFPLKEGKKESNEESFSKANWEFLS